MDAGPRQLVTLQLPGDGSELPVGFPEFLRYDASFAYRGHEIHIAGPAGKDVHMNVSGDARARAVSYVHAGIEPRRAVDKSKILLGDPRQQHHLGGDIGLGFLKGRDVGVRSDHQVSARIREEIQQDKVVPRAMQNKIFRIAIFLRFFTENAVRTGLGGADVPVPPGAPEMIHPQL